MDKEKLRQYRSIRHEMREVRGRISRAERSLAELEEGSMAADVVSGGEGGTRHYKVEGFPYPEYERRKSRLYMSKLRMESLEGRLHALEAEVEEFITEVGDSRMRRILSFRYLDGMSWCDVARNMGKGTSADAVRMEHDRFLKRLQQ